MKIFESRTESEPTGYGKPDPALIKVLRNESTEAEEGLDYCSKEKKLAAEDILLVHPVAERDGKTLYFVRPTLAPYCGPFYGAHSFHFWFVEKSKSSGAPKYTVVLEWRSDRAVVLKNIHNGRNDVLTEYCVAAGCDGEIRTYCPVLGKYIESQAYHVKSDMPD